MSTESTQTETLDRDQPVEINTEFTELGGGNQALAIIPTTIGAVEDYAHAVKGSGLVPATLDTVPKVIVAILKGLELGLPPMQALENIAVINGRASIWGDIGLALIQRSGLMEHFSEGFTGDIASGTLTAWVKMKRKGLNDKPTRKTFSIEDAISARLWDGMSLAADKRQKSQWVLRPKVMLQWRCRWLVMHALFSDVLRNMPGAEEMIDEIPMRDVTPKTQKPRQDIGSRLKAGQAPEARVWGNSSPASGSEAETVDDTGDSVDGDLGQDDGQGGGSSMPLYGDAGGDLRAELRKALGECHSAAEVKVAADEFAAVIRNAPTAVQMEMDDMIAEAMLNKVGR